MRINAPICVSLKSIATATAFTASDFEGPWSGDEDDPRSASAVNFENH